MLKVKANATRVAASSNGSVPLRPARPVQGAPPRGLPVRKHPHAHHPAAAKNHVLTRSPKSRSQAARCSLGRSTLKQPVKHPCAAAKINQHITSSKQTQKLTRAHGSQKRSKTQQVPQSKCSNRSQTPVGYVLKKLTFKKQMRKQKDDQDHTWIAAALRFCFSSEEGSAEAGGHRLLSQHVHSLPFQTQQHTHRAV